MEAIATQNGGIISRYTYDAFGNVITRTEGAYASRVLYCGYKFDAESELYYLNARYYDTETARFITADSYMGETTAPQTLNRYSYCVNEPLRHWDPTGHVVTAYDAAHCSAYQQALLAQYSNMWNAAYAAGDSRGMTLAHQMAEQVRSYSGYSTNASGMGVYVGGQAVAYNNSAIYLSNNANDVGRLNIVMKTVGNEGFEEQNEKCALLMIKSGFWDATAAATTDACIGIRQATCKTIATDPAAAKVIGKYFAFADSIRGVLEDDERGEMKKIFTAFMEAGKGTTAQTLKDKKVNPELSDLLMDGLCDMFYNVIIGHGFTFEELVFAFSAQNLAENINAVVHTSVQEGQAKAAQKQAERNAKDVPTNIKVDNPGNGGKTWDYSSDFEKQLDNFNDGYEIHNAVDNDLYIVQIHSGAEVGNGRSLKYWTTYSEMNGISTIEEYMNKMSLLKEWGSRDYVSIAKIPAGTNVKYAIGTARELSKGMEYRAGGGLQILFEQFNESWIIATKHF